ncbi:MAG: hypothetical protein GY756_27280 [bacterium]|nr:hypothetical protein [bacterium]
MDSENFLKRECAFSLAVSGMHLLGSYKFMTQAPNQNQELDREELFKEIWITSLIENTEDEFDKENRCRLMNTCGRECAKRDTIRFAEQYKNNVSGMMEFFSQSSDLEFKYAAEDTIQVIYKKCVCELNGHGPGTLTETYCECSKGWLLEMFETASQKNVNINIIRTVKRGADICEFEVFLS